MEKSIMCTPFGHYIFDDGDYKYYFALNNLNSISYLSAIEDNNGNRLNLNRTTSSKERQ